MIELTPAEALAANIIDGLPEDLAAHLNRTPEQQICLEAHIYVTPPKGEICDE